MNGQGRLHITMRVGGAIIAISIRLSILVPVIVKVGVGVGVRLRLEWHWVCLAQFSEKRKPSSRNPINIKNSYYLKDFNPVIP